MLVTGLGVVCPLGVGRDQFFAGLREGRVAIRRVDEELDLSGIRARVAGVADGFDPLEFLERKRARRMGRATQMAVAAARLACQDAGFTPRDTARGGVAVGTGIGAMEALVDNHLVLLERGAERVSPFLAPIMMPNAPAAEVSIELGIRGPSLGVVTACAAGAHAIGIAWGWIREGLVDWVLAGGAESVLIPLVFAAFDRMGALSRNPDPATASRPFDADRDGFVLGEGAGMLLLESEQHARRRGAQPLAELAGFGLSSDAFHITAPPEDGAGALAAMAGALKSAGLSPEEVDYINAHGTSTPLNDRAETAAIKGLFGERAYRVPVSSTKSQIGHLLGASGAVEAGAALFALVEGLLPATVTWRRRDPECDLDYVPAEPRPAHIRTALSNSFGFGGQNACLAFRTP